MNDARRADDLLASMLAHREKLRRLLVGLVGSHDADDALQETWIRAQAAQRSGARAKTPALGGWLRTIARNAALRSLKRRAAAAAREREAPAIPQAARSPDQVLEELDAQRRLHAALMELSADDRSLLLLRYFEDQPPEAIARHLGVNTSTVRSRIARARQRLRSRLERREGPDGRAQLLAVLLPEAFGAKATAMGAVLMAGATVKVAACVLVAAGAAGTWMAWRADDRSPPRAPEVVERSHDSGARPLADALERRAADERALAAAPITETRTPVAAGTDPAASVPTGTAQPTWTISGRIVEKGTRRPVANAPLLGVHEDGTSVSFDTSAADGSFASKRAVPAGNVTTRWQDDARGVDLFMMPPTVLTELAVGTDPVDDLLLAIPWRGRVHGRVVDDEGTPVPEARVRALDVAFRGDSIDIEDDFEDRAGSVTTSSADGTFVVPHVRDDRGVRLLVTAEGFAPVLGPPLAPPFGPDAAPQEIVLGPGGSIRGIVLDAGNHPVGQHDVMAMSLAEDWLTRTGATGADGTFELSGLPHGHYLVSAGLYFEVTVPSVRVARGEVPFVELRLPARVRIAGVVLDATGAPVRLETKFMESDRFGRWTPKTGLSVSARWIDPPVEKQSVRLHHSAPVAEEGTFEFNGVEPGRYELAVGSGLPGDPTMAAEVAAPILGVRLVWDPPPPAMLTLRARAAATGEPVETWCSLVECDGHGRLQMSSHDGNVTMEVRSGQYTVTAFAETFAPARLKTQVPAEGSTVEFSLEPGRHVRGVVRDEAGKPVAGARVAVVLEPRGAANINTAVTSDPDGRFVVTSAPPSGGYLCAFAGSVQGPAEPITSDEIVLRFR